MASGFGVYSKGGGNPLVIACVGPVWPPPALLSGARTERPGKCRGARTGPGGEISDAANEAVAHGAIRSRRQVRVTRRVAGTGMARREPGELARGRRARVEVEICSGTYAGVCT